MVNDRFLKKLKKEAKILPKTHEGEITRAEKST
jgi:hypothetical protein